MLSRCFVTEAADCVFENGQVNDQLKFVRTRVQTFEFVYSATKQADSL